MTHSNHDNLLNSLLLFRQKPDTLLCRLLDREESVRRDAQAELITKAVTDGWRGNLWHCCLASALMESESVYALRSERREAPAGTLQDLALADMEIIRKLFSAKPSEDFPALLESFREEDAPSANGARRDGDCPSDSRVSETAAAFSRAQNAGDLLTVLNAYYRSFGTGIFGKHQVFRINSTREDFCLVPLENRPKVTLKDLIGYEDQKKKLYENTAAFAAGSPANNVLLYGDAGTGKSTSIQAVANELAPRGLRVIEICRDQYGLIPPLMQQLKERNYRFLLFLDDLSFEEDETSFKYLKAVLEGGAQAAPENVRIYATSNRRHLIRETWKDRSDMEHDGDIHRSDTVEEKLSLSSRFGLQIFYPAPSFEEYQTIVSALSARHRETEDLPGEELRKAAATWQVRSGSRSGRTAQQFVNSLLCAGKNRNSQQEEKD